MTKLVILESPFAGDVAGNLTYAHQCVKDMALIGESAYASHIMLTQALDDLEPSQRKLGLQLGEAWRPKADYTVFYTDRGWSRGMLAALESLVEGTEYNQFYFRSLSNQIKLPELKIWAKIYPAVCQHVSRTWTF